MNSSSEQKYSTEELKERNKGPETRPQEVPILHPTAVEWETMLTILSAQYRLLAALYDHETELPPGAQESSLGALRQETEELERELRQLNQTATELLELARQAGKPKEKRFTLPKLSLPRVYIPRPGWPELLLAVILLLGSWAVRRVWIALSSGFLSLFS